VGLLGADFSVGNGGLPASPRIFNGGRTGIRNCAPLCPHRAFRCRKATTCSKSTAAPLQPRTISTVSLRAPQGDRHSYGNQKPHTGKQKPFPGRIRGWSRSVPVPSEEALRTRKPGSKGTDGDCGQIVQRTPRRMSGSRIPRSPGIPISPTV